MKRSAALKSYRFELWHLVILFLIIAVFQIILSYIHNVSTSNLLTDTMDLYRRDSAERIADMTTSSLEFLLERNIAQPPADETEFQALKQQFNMILGQQKLQKNVDQVLIIYDRDDQSHIISDGQDFITVVFRDAPLIHGIKTADQEAVKLYGENAEYLRKSEQIFSYTDRENIFHILVPFVPQGEYSGVVYMRIDPDFSNIAEQISTTYNETAVLFSALILLGILAMFYISSYTVQERDEAKEQLFKVRERQIRRQIEHEKEAQFTRRIYHTHHKAEKVMGFIKEDLRQLTNKNLEKIRFRVSKYANFISRVIYDMKAYDPPIQVIRNSIFRSDLNSIIEFIIENIFQRVYQEGGRQKYVLELDRDLPTVQINEYVIWEIVEPLMKNSIDHNADRDVTISIRTSYDRELKLSRLVIDDDGNGFTEEVLRISSGGQKKLFTEFSTTTNPEQNSGYGCYIAYENCKRCGWDIDAINNEQGGARILITILV